MKKLLSALLLVLTSLSGLAFEYGGINYEVIDENAKTCRTVQGSSTSMSGDVIIPPTVFYNDNNYTVVEIGTNTFYNYRLITSVTLPDCVTSIAANAFYRCSLLQSINIPESVSSIGEYAFYGCSELTSIHLPGNISVIPDRVFASCSKLASVNIPAGVTSIGEGAFRNCNALTSITIPENVTEIGRSAFDACQGLTTLVIPEKITVINYRAFSSCINLTSVQLPENLKTIGDYAFAFCNKLSTMNIPTSVDSIGTSAFGYCKELKEIYYPAENPIESTVDVFDESIYPTATLYVPAAAVDKAAITAPWNLFSNIKAYDFTSAIADIATDIDPAAPVEVYNVSGMKVADSIDSLPAGIYIVSQGNTVKKI
ncbi:MAG: leucine-rich repeat domain-containing protein, partial [Duncaniella sp.]|nr:leucine-rich repeat domain-containing protein [Duncaniella sp.]